VLVESSMNRVLLSSQVSSEYNARCLDGTVYGYFYQQSTSQSTQNNWVFYFQGGGVCYAQSDCDTRAASDLGSSSYFSATYDDTTNFLSTSAQFNPDYYNWNHVFVPYCTGDAHLGQHTTATVATWNLYFSGHLNVIAMLDSLRNTTALNNVTQMLVTGSSAGGIATNHYADFFTDAFPKAKVVASPQAGWFFPSVITYSNFTGHPAGPSDAALLLMYDAFFDESCVAANSGVGSDPTFCFSMTNVYSYITTPLMIAQNRFDEYQVFESEGLPSPLNVSSASAIGYLQYFGKQQIAAMQQMKLFAKDGLFLMSCLNHTENLGLFSSKIGGLSYRDVLGDWHFQRNTISHFVYDTCGSLPCNSQCEILTPPPGSGIVVAETDPFASAPGGGGTTSSASATHAYAMAVLVAISMCFFIL